MSLGFSRHIQYSTTNIIPDPYLVNYPWYGYTGNDINKRPDSKHNSDSSNICMKLKQHTFISLCTHIHIHIHTSMGLSTFLNTVSNLNKPNNKIMFICFLLQIFHVLYWLTQQAMAIHIGYLICKCLGAGFNSQRKSFFSCSKVSSHKH